MDSIASLPGNLSAMELSSEKKGREGEKDLDIVGKGKAESIMDEVCWLYE